MMIRPFRAALAWGLSAILALAPITDALAQQRNSFRPIFQPGGGVSSSTNKPAVGATTATGQVPAGASASCKRNGTVTGSASVTAQGSVTCTFGSAIVAGDQFSIPWTLTGESPAATASNGPPPPVTIPANTALPVIAGTPQVGQTLASSTGSWSGSPTSYAYAWSVGGTQVQAGSSNTYVAQSGDVGKTLSVTVTATNTAGSASSTSAATSAVTAAPVNLANGVRMMDVGHSYTGNGANTNNAVGANATSFSTQDVNLSEAVVWQGAGVRTETFPSADTTTVAVGNTNARYYSGSSFGRGTETLAQTLSRMTDTTAAGVLNVNTAAPDVVLIRNEGQNENWAGSTVVSDGITSLKAMIDTAFAAGAKRVIVTTEVPSGTSSTSNLALNYQAWNAGIRNLANYRSGVLVLDQAAIFGAPSGWVQAPAGWLRSDNIHPSNIGTYWIAKGANGVQGLKALLDSIVPTGHGWFDALPRLSTLTTAQEYLTGSGALSGTNISGVKPTAISLTGTVGSTIVGALRANPLIGTDPGSGVVPAGAQYWDLTVTPAGTNATESFALSWAAPPSASALAGQYVQVEYEIDLPANVYLFGNTLSISCSGSSRLVGQAAVSTNGPNDTRSVKILSNPLLIPASPTTFNFSGAFAYRAADAVAAGAAPFTITLRAVRARVVGSPKTAWNYTQ